MILNFDKYNFLNFINSLNINYNEFNLYPEYFNHKSNVHGINHTFRVMNNCLLIGNEIKDKLNTRRAFIAAYIHDMARTHDYPCKIHGKNSCIEKLPLFTDLFISNGMNEEDLESIELSVSNHSETYEIDKKNPYYPTVAILRDADGLDLIRLDINIKPEILRYKETIRLIKITEEIYHKTNWKNYNRFVDFLKDI